MMSKDRFSCQKIDFLGVTWVLSLHKSEKGKMFRLHSFPMPIVTEFP